MKKHTIANAARVESSKKTTRAKKAPAKARKSWKNPSIDGQLSYVKEIINAVFIRLVIDQESRDAFNKIIKRKSKGKYALVEVDAAGGIGKN